MLNSVKRSTCCWKKKRLIGMFEVSSVIPVSPQDYISRRDDGVVRPWVDVYRGFRRGLQIWLVLSRFWHLLLSLLNGIAGFWPWSDTFAWNWAAFENTKAVCWWGFKTYVIGNTHTTTNESAIKLYSSPRVLQWVKWDWDIVECVPPPLDSI